MNLRRLGGYALCVSALISLLQTLWYNLGGDNSTVLAVVALLGGVLFIAGLPAIQGMQPQTGRLGQVGLALMAAAALIALGVILYSAVSESDAGELVPLVSALLALAGDLLVGWVTVRAGVFAPWVGWLLMAGGVLNFVGGLMPAGGPATAVGLVSAVVMPVALIGYGLPIVLAPEAVATDGKTGV